jgi:preprotein translocase subunit SecY
LPWWATSQQGADGAEMANPIPNLFRVPELKEKILFTLFILLIYRIGAHITVPGLDSVALRAQFGQLQGTLFGVYDMFTGGGLARATIFALGIMPYISASIMFQLLAAVFPPWRSCRRRVRTVGRS